MRGAGHSGLVRSPAPPLHARLERFPQIGGDGFGRVVERGNLRLPLRSNPIHPANRPLPGKGQRPGQLQGLFQLDIAGALLPERERRDGQFLAEAFPPLGLALDNLPAARAKSK